jgi:hypothetical protein
MQADLETGDTKRAPEGQPAQRSPESRPALRVVGSSARVVIADGDAARRAGLLDDLTQTMPEVTTFLEASTVAQMLEHARGSRMVIVGGPLDDVPTSALIRMLAQRFPDLHVVDMDVSTQSDQ